MGKALDVVFPIDSILGPLGVGDNVKKGIESQTPKPPKLEDKKPAPTTTDAQRKRKIQRELALRTGGRASTYLTGEENKLG